MAKLLIIDDEKLARFAVRKVLENAGHQIVEAADGIEGTNLCRAERFDAVITDIVMPHKAGLETIVDLRRDYPDLPMIAISGGARTHNEDSLKLAKQFGANKVLSKPFSELDLVSAVESVLAEASARRG
jgi:CheY-like chemotaxis protein